jgi:hypothetical protein
MRRFAHGTAAVTALALALAAALASGCIDDGTAGPVRCPAADPAASVVANGRYRYASYQFTLRGSITFAQEAQPSGEQLVRVTDTTYDNANDRPLVGQATLQGNRLDIRLVPKAGNDAGNHGGNDAGDDAPIGGGRPDYDAQVSFVFYEAGARFCVLGFSDSNGDIGGSGSYFGQMQITGAQIRCPVTAVPARVAPP